MYWFRVFVRFFSVLALAVIFFGLFYLFTSPHLLPSWLTRVGGDGELGVYWWVHVGMGVVLLSMLYPIYLVADPGAGRLADWKTIYASAERLVPESSVWASGVLVKLDRAHGLGFMRRRPRWFASMRKRVAEFDEYGAECIEDIRLMRGYPPARIRSSHRHITNRITEISDFEKRVDRFLRRRETG